MKTKKQTGKKVLSVFLAVLMVMTAWVFVAPTEAEAAVAATIKSTNEAELAKISGTTEITANVTGRFTNTGGTNEGDTDSEYSTYGSTYYKNVLYSPPNTWGSQAASVYHTDSNSTNVTYYMFYPTTVLMYDDATIPQMGAVFCVDPSDNYKAVMQSVWLKSNATGLALGGNWKGYTSGKIKFYLNMTNGTEYLSTTGSKEGSLQRTTAEDNWEFFANTIRFTGTMSDTEYSRTIKPTWGFLTGTNQYYKGIRWRDGASHNTSATASTPIYVINVKPLKAAYTEALSVYNTLMDAKNDGTLAKYTTASVKTFVELANALLAANPNNYDWSSNTATQVTNYATNAAAAVSAWNAWGGLEIQKYSVTFKDVNGNEFSQNYNYGTAVDCASIAAGLGNTIKQIDKDYHQSYSWNTATYVTTVTDDVVITETANNAENHTYGGWTQNENDHTRTCTACGYVQTQGHIVDYNKGYPTKEETCTEDGEMTYDCSVCGKKAIETSVINKITGHDFSGEIVIKEEGENGSHWKKCVRFDECGAYGWAGVENKCEYHNWDKNSDGTVDASDAEETKASTCKEAGYEKYTCKVCSATWTKTLDLATHTIAATAAKNVTNVCGGEGNIAYWTCSVCNRVWKDAGLANEISNVDADNDGIPDAAETKGPDHEFTGAYVSASAGENGKHYRQCTRFTQCNTYGPEEKHTWGAPAVENATCTKEGSKTYTCTLCPQTYTETISKVAHEMTKIDAVTPKCGIAGNYEYYSCSTCGKYYKDEAGTTETTVSAETIPALEHTWTAHHDYDTLKDAATCQNAAVYYNHCDYCKVQMTGTHTDGDPDKVNGHKFDGEIVDLNNGKHAYKCTVEGCTEYGNQTDCVYKVVDDVASTCHTFGYTTYECETCGHGYSTYKKEYDSTNHEGGIEVKDAIEATCNTNGYTGDTYCLGCGDMIAPGTTITADPAIHPHENMQDYEGKAATCQTEGYKAYKYCDQCGTYEIAKETIAKKDHKFTTYKSNGDGTHTATCDTCDPTVGTPATKDGNCSGGTANCVDKAVCTVCGGKYGDFDSANHKTVNTVKKKDSTCQTVGHEAYRKCEACGVDIDPITPIAKKDHVYGSWSANNDGTHSRSCTTCDAAVAAVAKETAGCSGGVATCKDKAKCEVCKAEYGEINSANHATQAATLKNAKEASCTEEGYTGDRHYNCCDDIKEKGTTIPKLDHKYTVALEDTKVASTCTEKGSIEYKCETCTATEKRELELNPQNHSSEETIVVNDKAATCESDGYTGDTYHKCCYKPGGSTAENRYALISKGTVIKANGQHVYSPAVPEYMIKKIVEEKDAEGNVTSRSFDLKDEEPAYAEKIGYRHDDNYWYHKQICTICYEVVETRCYTYPDHRADCVNTDSCFVCKGLCSLTNPDKHTLKEIEKISATCEKNGRKAYYVCEACGKEFFDLAGKNEITDENKSQLVIPSTMKHTIDRDETPIADNKGNHTYSCSVCGTAIVEACSGGEATCKDKAKCEYCGVEYGELNKNKHVKGTIIQGKVDPDRCKPGVSGKTVYECCPDVVVYEGDIIPATEPHDWKETTDKADNCANGYTITKTCNYCGEVETTEVAAGTHDLSVVVYETEKDCKKERTIYYACSICGFTDKEVEIDGVTYKYIFAEVIEAKEDCTWTSWTYEQKPSCVVEGKKTRKCVACGKTEEEILPKTDHTIKTEAGYAATCDKAGKQDYVYCVIEGCPYAKGGAPIGQLAGYEKYKDCNGKVIEALGHGDHNGDDYCDHCGGFLHENEDGTNCNCICHKRHWFMRIIYKILRFFWKLFGISRTCCSAGVHY